MASHLPSLNALRAFEAAGRHLSFSKAAEELHVTPAAVGHQVKALEHDLGTVLSAEAIIGDRALRLVKPNRVPKSRGCSAPSKRWQNVSTR